MSPDLDRALCERYPQLFARRHDRTSCMAEGFSCHDGWYHLIDVLCLQLQSETAQKGAPQLVAHQVKQKFGELRFSVGPDATPRQRAMIELTRTLSLRTCEICGAPAMERDGDVDWIDSRCEAHDPQLTAEQHAVGDALQAAYGRYFAEVFSGPGAGERLRAVVREHAHLDGRVIAGEPQETSPKLRSYIVDELTKRGIEREV